MMRIRSGRVRPRGRGLVLSLLDEEGLEGRGEASPLAGYSIDDLDSVLRAFESEPWVGLEIDLDGSPAAGAARAIQRIDERVPSARFALATAAELFGATAAVEIPTPVMGAEDWSYVLQQVPGAMAFLGTRPKGVAPHETAPNHSNRMVLDEDAMVPGIATYASVALRWLARPR